MDNIAGKKGSAGIVDFISCIMNRHIFLIGYRGAGKSTIGRQLATVLGLEVVDTDQMVCRASGMTVPEIVAREGWEGFRRRERAALVEAASAAPKIVATGGGAVLHQEVWQTIRDRVYVVWLSADVATLAQRIAPARADGSDRPSLTGEDITVEIDEVLRQRLPLYEQLADLRVDTGKGSIGEVVRTIAAAYRRHDAGSGE